MNELADLTRRRAAYRQVAAENPGLFVNPAGAAFQILLDENGIREAEAQMAIRLTAVGAPAEWANVGVAFRDQYTLILRDAVRFADGSLGTYIRMVSPIPGSVGVVILPVWQGNVLLIRHFRHATRSWHIEIPRGFGTSRNKWHDARRELTEEISGEGVQLTDLGEMYPDTGAGSGKVALFYAEMESYGRPEEIEGIAEILPTPVHEFEQMIRDGVLEDGYLLAAYARAKARMLI